MKPTVKQLGWKASAFLKLARLLIAAVVIWHALPMANALKSHFVEEGQEKLASVGTVDYNDMYDRFKTNFRGYYDMSNGGSVLTEMFADVAPSYAGWVVSARKATDGIKQQNKKILMEAYFVQDFEGSWHESVKRTAEEWDTVLDQKLAAYVQKGEEKFGPEAITLAAAQSIKNVYVPKSDWARLVEMFSSYEQFQITSSHWKYNWALMTDFQKYVAIASEGITALKLLMIMLFFYFLVKAKLHGFKLRFELVPHRALLGTVVSPFLAAWNFLCPMDSKKLYYPFGTPASQMKSALNFTFSVLFYGLTICSGGAAKAQSSGQGNAGGKSKNEKVLVMDLRYGDTFDESKKAQRTVKFTYLGAPEDKWLIESTTTDTASSITEQFLVGYKVKAKPLTVNVVAGIRSTFQKNSSTGDSHSLVGGVQLAYRRPNQISFFVPALNFESELTKQKRKTVNFGSQVIQERKKFDFGGEFTFRQRIARSAPFQWTAGAVIAVKASKKLPRIEFGMFRNYLNETSWRIRLGYQFKF